jgi:hypothetical protein
MVVEIGMERARLIIEDRKKGIMTAQLNWWTCVEHEFRNLDKSKKIRVKEFEKEDFDWYSPDMLNETYFCYTNTNRRTMQKGEQAFNCYGNYSNRSLIKTYGFCFPGNRFMSITFYLVISGTNAKTSVNEFVRLLPPTLLKKNLVESQYARLKTDQLSDKLLYFIRSLHRNTQKAHITRPIDVGSEEKVIKKYIKVIEHLKDQLEKETTLEQDLELLESEQNFQIKIGIVYRSENKRIIRSQLHLANKIHSVLVQC